MAARMQEVPIIGIDKRSWAFLGADGARYFEVDADIFTRDGIVKEGVLGFHGSGSHGGHIVLKPFYRRHQGSWINVHVRGASER